MKKQLGLTPKKQVLASMRLNKHMLHNLPHIINGCRQGDRDAQRALYTAYRGVLMGIARRYMKQEEDAEDVLVGAFFKIFKKVSTYKGDGSFEGWMKRIVVNEALMTLRKRTNFNLSVESDHVHLSAPPEILHDLRYSDIMRLIDTLPVGYRTVFNMYAIEGYKHREIAEELGISINTAKSQYLHAKKRLADLIKKKTTTNNTSA